VTAGDRRAPAASNTGVRRRMQAMGRRDTSPEFAVRRELHRRGLRYRVDHPLPDAGPRRRADVVFPRARLAIYVDGCFWHGCPDHGSQPRTNSDYWAPKLAANRDRDRDTDTHLQQAGWTVLRVWEHESATAAADRIEAALRALTAPPRTINTTSPGCGAARTGRLST
jgi:DNA mismatch endonuclease (patch repair protein)